MDKLDLQKNNLKKFGMTMGSAFLIISGIVFLRHRHGVQAPVIIAGIFFVLGLAASPILKPVYVVWMRLAFVLNWISTRVILIVLFYLMLTPIGLLMRLLGKDPLDRRIEKNRDTYWHKKEKNIFSSLNCQRQF